MNERGIDRSLACLFAGLEVMSQFTLMLECSSGMAKFRVLRSRIVRC